MAEHPGKEVSEFAGMTDRVVLTFEQHVLEEDPPIRRLDVSTASIQENR